MLRASVNERCQVKSLCITNPEGVRSKVEESEKIRKCGGKESREVDFPVEI